MKFKKLAVFTLTAGAILFSTTAKADDLWGCEVLLCLSNPAGPMAVGACVPPIQRLYKAIFKPKPDPFPSCAMANNAAGGNYAEPEYNDYYDECPGGTVALDKGKMAVNGSANDVYKINVWNSTSTKFSRNDVLSGIGSDFQPNAFDGWQGFPNKICVGDYYGDVLIDYTKSREYYDYRPAGVYGRVHSLPAYSSGFSIRVYQDHQMLHVVRP